MRIVYCIAGTYNSGGMERMLSLKANELVRRGHEVVVVTTDQRGRVPYFRFEPEVRHFDLNINYEENNGAGLLSKVVNYPGKQRRHRAALKRLLGEVKPDVTVSMFCNEAPILRGMKEGGAKVLEIHFSRFKRLQYGRKGVWGLVDRLRSANDRRVARGYDRFVVLTQEDAELWGTMGNMCVIPNFCDPDVETRRADVAGSRRVMAVGRISHQKGFERLVDAWALVSGRFPGWRLAIFGNGGREGLRQQAEALGVADSVELREPVAEIQREYEQTAVLAMTSRYEGLPMVLIEARRQGVPIVSFDCKCGPKDVVRHGVDGLLVSEGDVDGFADALGRLMANEQLRLRMQEQALADSERFDKNMIMDKWVKLFEESVRENER